MGAPGRSYLPTVYIHVCIFAEDIGNVEDIVEDIGRSVEDVEDIL